MADGKNLEQKIEKVKKEQKDYHERFPEIFNRTSADFTPNVAGRKNSFRNKMDVKMGKSIEMDKTIK